MTRPSAPTRALRAAVRLYRELDYVGRRSFELRTGVSVIDPWERFARTARRPGPIGE